MHIDDIIGQKVAGHSFIDIGGLWGTVNERVSAALRGGAREAAMFDHAPADSPLWDAFKQRCVERGVSGYRCIRGDLDIDADTAPLGVVDVVHCSGVLYHVPNPVLTVERLARLTGKWLLLGSCTLPERVENAAGSLDLRRGRMLFAPGMSEPDRAVLARYFDGKGIQLLGVNSTAPFGWGQPGAWDYSPWWWHWSVDTVASMVELNGLRVRATFENWPGLSHYLVCERV